MFDVPFWKRTVPAPLTLEAAARSCVPPLKASVAGAL